MQNRSYRGRLAPSPTGFLHPGHLATFLKAASRSRERQGTLLYRMEDLDGARCRLQYDEACLEDLRPFMNWQEGPDIGGPFGPYRQSERLKSGIYHKYWKILRDKGFIYPSPHSRKEIRSHLRDGEDLDTGDILFPQELRRPAADALAFSDPGNTAFRFRVEPQTIEFTDLNLGCVTFQAGQDFGDFLIWSNQGYPSYEFAVVVDDHLMEITEVVRGQDLLLSTARQLLIYRALGWSPPDFYHCSLLRTGDGQRLSKRRGSCTLRSLQERGWTVPALKEACQGSQPNSALIEAISGDF